MTLYLWHMLPVLIVAAALYLPGLAPEPAFGSAAWWWLRLPWLLVLGVVLAGAVAGLRPLEGRLSALYERTRPQASPPRPLLLWIGLAASTGALARFATQGFAYGGRFPVLPAAGLAVGAALVLLDRRRGVRYADEPREALEEAA
jgi:hypothetical protein